MSNSAPISISLLHEVLAYDPETGIFRWKVKRGNRRAGDIAGSPTQHGYIAIGTSGRFMFAHRVAWAMAYGEWPSGGIDHINGVRTDNRISNLRTTTQLVNTQNRRRANRTTKSGLIGASWKSKIGRWVAQIRFGGKLHHLGYFETAEKAHSAYMEAKRRHHAGCTV